MSKCKAEGNLNVDLLKDAGNVTNKIAQIY